MKNSTLASITKERAWYAVADTIAFGEYFSIAAAKAAIAAEFPNRSTSAIANLWRGAMEYADGMLERRDARTCRWFP